MLQSVRGLQSHVSQLLLASVSVSALVLSAPAVAQDVPGIFVSIEGGAAKAFGDDIGFTQDPLPFSFGNFLFNNRSDLKLTDDEWGWTGRIGFGQQAPGAFFGMSNSWAIFVRHTDFRSQNSTGTLTSDASFYLTSDGSVYGGIFPNYTGPVAGSFDEKRTVVDFEVGQDIGIGAPGLKVGVFGGVRYARFKSDSSISGTITGSYALYYNVALNTDSEFNGVGPRIGVQTTIPLGANIGFALAGSASALYGSRDTRTTSVIFDSFFGVTTTTTSKNDERTWVKNVEAEAALTFGLGPGSGELDLGVRGEAWFDQSVDYATASGRELDRNNWGPFARYKLNLSGP